MFGSLLLNEILFSIIWGIGILVLREFIISKDGVLRKIMIAYFSVEVYTYVGAGLYFLTIHYKWNVIPVDVFRVVIILPKVAVKLWLLWYLRVGKYKKTV